MNCAREKDRCVKQLLKYLLIALYFFLLLRHVLLKSLTFSSSIPSGFGNAFSSFVRFVIMRKRKRREKNEHRYMLPSPNYIRAHIHSLAHRTKNALYLCLDNVSILQWNNIISAKLRIHRLKQNRKR